MSRFGQNALAEQGVESTYIPHALEKVWKPTPSAVRRQMKVSDDAFLVMMNAANVGNAEVDRKAWSVNLRAFADFARDHDDAVLYLNTDPTGGFPIPKFPDHLKLDPDRWRFTDIGGYRSGFIPQSTIAECYTAADVLLAASMGEGFGLPVAEAMACGTPAIVTDFSAQPEIVGDTGWKVGFEPWYDKAAGADLALPHHTEIRDALEEAYAERGTKAADRRGSRALNLARHSYDADRVFNDYWRPFLAGLEHR
jgi:glycosyltransferase involved in cell wall biosynthesis